MGFPVDRDDKPLLRKQREPAVGRPERERNPCDTKQSPKTDQVSQISRPRGDGGILYPQPNPIFAQKRLL